MLSMNYYFSSFKSKFSSPSAFTLIELIVVIAILGILASAVIFTLDPKAQLDKASDAERKSDLSHIQRALEEYYNDHNGYPEHTADGKIRDQELGDIDWGTNWGNYLTIVPKDPADPRKKYSYRKISVSGGYAIYTSLDRTNDPDICNGLDKTNHCPLAVTRNANCGSSVLCNYGVSSPNLKP